MCFLLIIFFSISFVLKYKNYLFLNNKYFNFRHRYYYLNIIINYYLVFIGFSSSFQSLQNFRTASKQHWRPAADFETKTKSSAYDKWLIFWLSKITLSEFSLSKYDCISSIKIFKCRSPRVIPLFNSRISYKGFCVKSGFFTWIFCAAIHIFYNGVEFATYSLM